MAFHPSLVWLRGMLAGGVARSRSSFWPRSGADRAGLGQGLAVPQPEQALCLIGDIHGRADLLQTLLLRHDRDFADHRLVFLGDMIDRGQQSARVLQLVRARVAQGAVALRGNHEAMLIAFLDAAEGAPDPARISRWLGRGGQEFFASYGLAPIPDEPAQFPAAVAVLRDVMGAKTEAWLRSLPLLWKSGDLVAAHAGMNPFLGLEAQNDHDLLWGNPTRTRQRRKDGLWVVHGHIVSDRPYIRDGRIALDTGAWQSGRLSFALIDPAKPPAARVALHVISSRRG
jgi:serine/threonine protein phosphatase 1